MGSPIAYPDGFQARILAASQPDTGRVDELCKLHFALGELFADATLRVIAEQRAQRALMSIWLDRTGRLSGTKSSRMDGSVRRCN